ncbi:MAG: hypothetical protein HOV78_20415 [Hamadaea sp.]|nr:hypothetical protein [Hamadaea sp.]NUO90646.1 hypothetical protein [Dermatophilaceae bacterium]
MATAAAKCPECGRISTDNRPHCDAAKKPGGLAWWAKHCLTYVCRCGVTYNTHGHYPRKAA